MDDENIEGGKCCIYVFGRPSQEPYDDSTDIVLSRESAIMLANNATNLYPTNNAHTALPAESTIFFFGNPPWPKHENPGVEKRLMVIRKLLCVSKASIP